MSDDEKIGNGANQCHDTPKLKKISAGTWEIFDSVN